MRFQREDNGPENDAKRRCVALLRGALALIAGMAICVSALRAQSKTGTAIGLFTTIDPSARSAAMGSAGTTAGGEAMSIFYNPASLGYLNQTDVQFTYNAWYADIALEYAYAALNLGDAGTASLSVTQLSSGDISVRTVAQPEGTGELYSVSDLQIGLGYGRKITDRFSVGIIVNYVNERIWHSSTSVFGLSIGTLYELSPGGLRIGSSLLNFGSKNRFMGTDLFVRYDQNTSANGDNSAIPAEITTDDFSLPIIFRVGVGYPFKLDDANTVNVAVDALHPSDNSESIDIGGEWVFKNVLYLRAGYQSLFQTDSDVGLTAGVGIAWDGSGYLTRFDYGWASHDVLGSVQRVTLGIAF